MCDKLGKYTTSAYQLSSQHGRYVNPSSSHSISLVARELLTTDDENMGPACAPNACDFCCASFSCRSLIADAPTWLMVLALVVAGLLIIYFCIRRSAADEMDQKKWNNRIVVAIVSCIGAVLGSATLNIIIGYYQ